MLKKIKSSKKLNKTALNNASEDGSLLSFKAMSENLNVFDCLSPEIIARIIESAMVIWPNALQVLELDENCGDLLQSN